MKYLPLNFRTLTSRKALNRSKSRTNPQQKMFKTKALRKSSRNKKNPTKVKPKQSRKSKTLSKSIFLKSHSTVNQALNQNSHCNFFSTTTLTFRSKTAPSEDLSSRSSKLTKEIKKLQIPFLKRLINPA